MLVYRTNSSNLSVQEDTMTPERPIQYYHVGETVIVPGVWGKEYKIMTIRAVFYGEDDWEYICDNRAYRESEITQAFKEVMAIAK